MNVLQPIAYAHSKQGLPKERWHALEDHLQGTAQRASDFAGKFESAIWGWYAGLWHDLGKFAPDWQSFLTEAGEDASSLGEETQPTAPTIRRRGPDHSTAGALHACEVIANPFVSKLLAFVIASHHAGLPNQADLFDSRLKDEGKRQRYRTVRDVALPSILAVAAEPEYPHFFPGEGSLDRQKRRFEMFIRFAFSALVDADFLDTERFMEEGEERSKSRQGWPCLPDYVEPLDGYLKALSRTANAAVSVSEARSSVLKWCLAAAHGKRGAYTLTVPTGGGKTLSSLVFALRHAQYHRLDRIIVALPFLSILDQTANVFRQIFEPRFAARALVEHHSTIRPERDTLRNRLAAENWDAPLIVTTQVQLFESLFARRPSDCRKLHNLANSVIVLDEVQSLPVGLLDAILESLQELKENYGATLLLTTATQPALHTRRLGQKTFYGLTPKPTEIVPEASIGPLFESLRRVDVYWPESADPTAWEDLAGQVSGARQALVIVHRRADAAELWRRVSEVKPDALHLSALMCPAHRRVVLADICSRLAAGEECHVVSTQLVEAGVDVDFPVVFRAMAGLESLAQSAGRCNREGKLERGSFFVYRAQTLPVGSLKHHKQIAETMLVSNANLELMAPETFREYFDRLYAERSTDEKGIQVSRQMLNFEDTARLFRMIDDVTTTVFVPYDATAERTIAEMRKAGPSRDRFRALQPYGVAIYPDAVTKLQSRGAIELLHDAVWVLVSKADYDPILGLRVDREGFDAFIV